MVPIVQLADQLSKGKEPLDPNRTRNLLTDSISLLGHSFYNLSQKRRYELKSSISNRYKKICNSDVPITNNLFGDNCTTRLKELGDISKYPIGISKFGNKFKGYGLNYKGPVADRSQQGNQISQSTGQIPRGRGRQNYQRGRGQSNTRGGQKKASYQNYNYQ